MQIDLDDAEQTRSQWQYNIFSRGIYFYDANTIVQYHEMAIDWTVVVVTATAAVVIVVVIEIMIVVVVVEWPAERCELPLSAILNGHLEG